MQPAPAALVIEAKYKLKTRKVRVLWRAGLQFSVSAAADALGANTDDGCAPHDRGFSPVGVHTYDTSRSATAATPPRPEVAVMDLMQAAAKRYKITGSGKVMRRKPGKQHINEKMSPGHLKRLGKETQVRLGSDDFRASCNSCKGFPGGVALARPSTVKVLVLHRGEACVDGRNSCCFTPALQVADSNLTNIIGESSTTCTSPLRGYFTFVPCAACQRACNRCVTCTIEQSLASSRHTLLLSRRVPAILEAQKVGATVVAGRLCWKRCMQL